PRQVLGELFRRLQTAGARVAAADYRQLRLPQPRRIAQGEKQRRRAGSVAKRLRVAGIGPKENMPVGRFEPAQIGLDGVPRRFGERLDGLGTQAEALRLGPGQIEYRSGAAEMIEQTEEGARPDLRETPES